MGDGGFMMNMQELETAKRLGVALTILVFNDNDYGLISWKQKRGKDHSYGTKLGNPDFVKLADSFGIKAIRPKSKQELENFLENSINNRELSLIEIPITPAVNEALVEKLNNYWSNK
jgi:acetolactate synthase-1/2/3 large subunit